MQHKILVVDNHPVMLKFMSNLLEKEGYQVRVAGDGLMALDIIKTWIPDVIFIDLVMPNITGEKLCRIIRSNSKLKNVFLVILSAIAAESDLDFTEFGADACIAKNSFDKMKKHIFTVLDYWEPGKQNAPLQTTLGLENVYRREITKELLSSKKHFETILTSMAEGILEIGEEKKIVYANPAAISMIGIPEHKLLASNFTNLFEGADFDRINDILGIIDDTPLTISDDEPIKLNNKDVVMNFLPVKSNEHYHIIVIMNDVSARKRMERQLKHAQLMETLATLAGGVAHQFNNALSGITGNIELLEMILPDGSGYAKYTNPMYESARRMMDLTNQLLAYAQGGKYKPQSISLMDFVKERLPKIKNAINPVIALKIEHSKGDVVVEADLTQMEMVLAAVIANADEARKERGYVRISLEKVELDDEFVKYAAKLKPGCYACLVVEDNGKGMDEQTKSKIFEPFFSTKFQGRGLSMAAVYGIVRSHNGWISVDSKSGQGTVVRIYLPAIDNDPKQEKNSKTALLKGTGTILIVEDEKTNFELLRAMLQHLGYRVLEAQNGKEAVELAEKFEEPIDLATMDMVLPDMSGQEVFDQIKERLPDIKVIVISGHDSDGAVQKILEAGAEAFIQKPFSLKTLSETVQKVMLGPASGGSIC